MLRKQGDLFFEEIYKQYSPRVLRLCMGYTGDAMKADDLLQETFIKVWQNLEKFRGDAQIGTWIYRIAVNTCLQNIRLEKKNESARMQEGTDVRAENDQKEQQVQLLYKCITMLEENDRLIIGLYLEEVPYAQIAQAVGITEGNLRVKIHRIKEQLSAIYRSYEGI